jgi:predicted DCC family thiol-disulfide oxidoreductase YuxK
LLYSKIILFDGVCNLCNSSVNFIIDRDKKNIFKFASIQSEAGNYYLTKFKLEKENLKTLILIDGDKFSLRSSAVLNIAKNLSFPIKLSYTLIIIPPFLRDVVYKFISNHRYSWFGKKESCRIPTPEIKDRFL